MGNFRSSPNSEKRTSNGEAGPYQYGTCAMQGWRITMEDAHLIHLFDWLEHPGSRAALFGVFDGHGGTHVAQFVREHLVQELVKAPEFKKGRFEVAFRKAYLSLDNLLPLESSQSELERFSRAEPLATFGATPVGVSRESDLAALVELEQSTALSELEDGSADEDDNGPDGEVRSANSSSLSSHADGAGPRHAPRTSTLRLGGRRLCKRQGPGASTAASTDSKERSSSASNSSNVANHETSSPFQAVKPACLKSTGSGNGAAVSSSKPLVPANSGGTAGTTNATGNNGSAGSPPSTGAASNNNSVLHSLKALFSGVIRVGNGLPRQSNGGYNGLAMLAGCTAVSVLVLDSKFIVANAGDSRCVLCRGKLAVDISRDHKPTLPSERSRIYSAGGWLEMGRVNGNLNLSRAIGDLTYKMNTTLPPERQIVTAVPDLMSFDITDEDEFLVIGCDGVWESSTSQEIVNFIRERIHTASQLSDILEALFEELLSPNPSLFEYGCDNMTAIIVDLHPDRRPRSRTNTDQLDEGAVNSTSSPAPPKSSSFTSPSKTAVTRSSSSSRKAVSPPASTLPPNEEEASSSNSPTTTITKPVVACTPLPILANSRENSS